MGNLMRYVCWWMTVNGPDWFVYSRVGKWMSLRAAEHAKSCEV